MMMMKDEWLSAALTDDSVVVELLLRLKKSSSEVSMPSLPSLLPPVSWGQRLPRSKLPNTFRKDSTTTTTTTTTTTRFSPTTPLSWSGGTAASLSDGAYDESSTSRASSDPSRSKGTFASEVTNICSTNKRSRKKKTFSELQEEEIILLKERSHLKTEFASVNATLKGQRVRSKNSKRIKIDLNQQSGESGAKTGEAAAVVPKQCKIEASTVDRSHSIVPRHATQDEGTLSCSCIEQEEDVKTSKRCFVLPDLNMTPTEDEISADIL